MDLRSSRLLSSVRRRLTEPACSECLTSTFLERLMIAGPHFEIGLNVMKSRARYDLWVGGCEVVLS